MPRVAIVVCTVAMTLIDEDEVEGVRRVLTEVRPSFGAEAGWRVGSLLRRIHARHLRAPSAWYWRAARVSRGATGFLGLVEEAPIAVAVEEDAGDGRWRQRRGGDGDPRPRVGGADPRAASRAERAAPPRPDVAGRSRPSVCADVRSSSCRTQTRWRLALKRASGSSERRRCGGRVQGRQGSGQSAVP